MAMLGRTQNSGGAEAANLAFEDRNCCEAPCSQADRAVSPQIMPSDRSRIRNAAHVPPVALSSPEPTGWRRSDFGEGKGCSRSRVHPTLSAQDRALCVRRLRRPATTTPPQDRRHAAANPRVPRLSVEQVTLWCRGTPPRSAPSANELRSPRSQCSVRASSSARPGDARGAITKSLTCRSSPDAFPHPQPRTRGAEPHPSGGVSSRAARRARTPVHLGAALHRRRYSSSSALRSRRLPDRRSVLLLKRRSWMSRRCPDVATFLPS